MKKMTILLAFAFSLNSFAQDVSFRLGSFHTFGKTIKNTEYTIVQASGKSLTGSTGLTAKMKGCYKEKKVTMEDYPFHVNYIEHSVVELFEVDFHNNLITIQEDLNEIESSGKKAFKELTPVYCKPETSTYVTVVLEYDGAQFTIHFPIIREGNKYYTKDILEKKVLLDGKTPIDFY